MPFILTVLLGDGMKSATQQANLLRGLVLSHAYDIETEISRIIEYWFYPPELDELGEQRAAFLDLYVEDTAVRLDQKLRTMRRILPHLPGVLNPESLLSDLGQVQMYRNNFAHSPISLERQKGSESLLPILHAKSGDLRLTDEKTVVITGLFKRVRNDLGIITSRLWSNNALNQLLGKARARRKGGGGDEKGLSG
jgi:hypothetical protein